MHARIKYFNIGIRAGVANLAGNHLSVIGESALSPQQRRCYRKMKAAQINLLRSLNGETARSVRRANYWITVFGRWSHKFIYRP